MTTLLPSGTTLRSRDALDDDVDLARDRLLVTRAQGGDRAAFDDLYLRYYRRLYRFCLRRLHDSHEAEDVAQESFARAWRALPSFGGDRRFYPWLSVIASHLCTDVLRRRNRSTPVAEFHQGNVASTEDGGEELMIAAVDQDLVARAFQRLSDRHQRILNLREGSGWSYQRIADHEGVGITAIETLLWRARQALKREFASLAGAEGRTGALAGGLLSLAGLRKLLRAPLHAARRVVHMGPAAVAVGSAAAATAVVVAATAGPALPATVPAPAPVLRATPAGSAARPDVTHPGVFFASPAEEPAAPAAGTGGVSVALPAVPPLGSGAVGGTLSTATQAVNDGVTQLLTGPDSLLSGVAGALGGTQDTTTVPGLLDNVLGATTPVAGAAATAAGPLLNGAATPVAGVLGAAGTATGGILGSGH
ncbi:MAG TPA: RNA polymerase sigma factor [Acidimicrobiales bacterium]|nr:RNA polymerase sigma factor [Acidimicrobiales bacterium]